MFGNLQALGIGIGTTELLIILAILLLLFGATRIPELGKSLGQGIKGFQRAVKEEDPPKQLESEAVAEESAEETPAAEPIKVESEVVDEQTSEAPA